MAVRVLSYARRLRHVATWFAGGTLIAGGALWMQWGRGEPGGDALLIGALLLAPGLVLLHFVRTVAGLPARFGVGQGQRARPSMLQLGVGLTFLLRPWYWSLVAISALAGLALMPLALIVTLGAAL